MDAAVKAGNPPDFAYFDRFVAGVFSTRRHHRCLRCGQPDLGCVRRAGRQCADQRDFGGKYYGIPYSTEGAGWFARKDWLAEKGIKVDDIKTFKDLRDVALQISDPSKNRYGWGMTVNQSGDGNGLIQSIINAYGGAGASDDGKKAILNSPETVDAVTFLADIYTNAKYKNMLPPGVLSWSDTGNNEAWLAGVIGSRRTSSPSTRSPTRPRTRSTTRQSSSPVSPAPRSIAHSRFGNYRLLRHLQGREEPGPGEGARQIPRRRPGARQYRQARNGLIMPAYKKLWDSDPYYQNGDPVFAASRQVVEEHAADHDEDGPALPAGAEPAWQQAYNSYVLTDMMGQIIQKGVKPADAVKQAQDRIVAAFNQLGVTQ